MDFINRAAAIWSKSAAAFPFNFDPKAQKNVDRDGLWAIYDGTKREDGSNVTVFTFDIGAQRSLVPLARNALKKLRTLRHPGIIKFIESYESDSMIFVATERVVPLSWDTKRGALNNDILRWGLFSISRTIKFLHESATSVHGNIRLSSIYTSEAGEWKLSGLEVLTNLKEDETAIFTYGSLLPESGRYASPEIIKGSWNVIKELTCLEVELTSGVHYQRSILGTLKGKMPQDIFTPYKRLLNPAPKLRLTVSQFLDLGSRAGSFFSTDLIKCSQSLENMSIKGDHERDLFLQQLDSSLQKYPPGFLHHKILPEMLKAFEFGGGANKVFVIILSIAEKLSDEDFEKEIQPVIVRMFGSQERGVRMSLLENLTKIIERLNPKVVNDKVFPNLLSGFTDAVPVIREQTVRAVLVVIPKLNDRNINGDLLKYLAKTQSDEQPGIRTNTTICLGKIAKHLGVNTRKKVLVAAFVRSLRDPFVHARNAGLMALSATAEYYEQEDCATKIIPSISLLLIDKEKIVRVQATKTMDVILARIAKLTTSMPDTALPVPVETPRSLTPSQPPTSSSSENFALTAGSALAGWAYSGLKKQVLGPDVINGDIRPDSAPPTQTRFSQKNVETPNELRGLGSQGDVDPWKDEEFDEDEWTRPHARQKSAPAPRTGGLGMKLPVTKKKSVVEKVVQEEEERREEEGDGAGEWPGLDDWDEEVKDGEDGWGFDD